MAKDPTGSQDAGAATSSETIHKQQSIQPKRQSTTFHFIGLPKELRLMIYDQLPRLAYQRYETTFYAILWKDWTYESAILRTCREVRDEASANIDRLVSKPLRTEILLPNSRALHDLIRLLDGVHTPKEEAVTNNIELGWLNSTANYGKNAMTPLRRIYTRLCDGSVVDIKLKFGPLDRVVDPEMYVDNWHSSISSLEEWVARHPEAQVELTVMSVDGEDEEIVEHARDHLKPAAIPLRWTTVTPEEVEEGVEEEAEAWWG